MRSSREPRVASTRGPRRLAFEEISTAGSSDFSERLAVIPDLLPPEPFEVLRRSALSSPGLVERSYYPGHERGGTVAHDCLRQQAPEIVAFYQSDFLRGLVSKLVGEDVHPTPANDQSSCSVLTYARPGDHIGWHCDYNFYRGRHSTLLLSAENRGRAQQSLCRPRCSKCAPTAPFTGSPGPPTPWSCSRAPASFTA